MRAYTVATAAVTLGMPPKWLDNVLSHHSIDGVTRSRQGVPRRLAPRAVLTLEIAIRLSEVLSIPTARALDVAQNLTQGASASTVEKGVTLTLDLESIKADLGERLAHAVEIAPLPKRGRPAAV